MGHLGQSTPITTVGDKEIVLTASNGQNFRMKVADLAEAVRLNMQSADESISGLLTPLILSQTFRSRGNASLVDFNDNTKTGHYLIYDEQRKAGNSPNFSYGMLLCVTVSSFVMQVAFDMFTPRMFYRFKGVDGIWRKWAFASFTNLA